MAMLRMMGTPGYVRAGVITVSGGTGDSISLTPDVRNVYFSMPFMAARWRAGEAIMVRATGERVPAFSGMLTFPPEVTVTTPVLSMPVEVDRAAGLTVRWTGTGAGNVVVTIAQIQSGVTLGVICEYPTAAGAGTIPPSALRDLMPATAATFGVATHDSRVVNAGGFEIRIRAMQDRTPVSANVR